MTTLPYIQDILSQPTALHEALNKYPSQQIEDLRARIHHGDFDRIVLTGMGSSFNSAYPAWLNLTELPIPALHINTAELLHYSRAVIGERTLLWINSQSGSSVEIVRLLEQLAGRRPAFQLSMTNFLNSPMAKQADLAVEIHAGFENTVSTKTFINTMAMLMLSSAQLAGKDWQTMLEAMKKTADALEVYLSDWQGKVAELDALLGEVDQLLLLGRGPSMASIWNGSLINKEAAKSTFEGMNVADFRHGPLELASGRLTLMILEGAPQTVKINRDLALEAKSYGTKVLWLAGKKDSELTTIQLPVVAEEARPLVEILPFQMLSILIANRLGLEPGKFRHISKVTLEE